MQTVIIKCDGSYHMDLPVRPGFAAWSAWVNGKEIAYWHGQVNVNNAAEAEFWAIIHALRWTSKQKEFTSVQILSDSKTAIFRLTSKKEPERYEKLCNQVWQLTKNCDTSFEWIHYRKNRRAHKLCREAFTKIKNSMSL